MMSTQGSITQGVFHVPLVLQRSPEIFFLGATPQMLRSEYNTEYNTVQSNFQDRELIDPPAMFAPKLTLLGRGGGLY